MKSLISVRVTALNNKVITENMPKYIPEKDIKIIMLFRLN